MIGSGIVTNRAPNLLMMAKTIMKMVENITTFRLPHCNNDSYEIRHSW